MLEIKNLHVKLADEDVQILKGVNLTIQKGEVHAVMGPNGSGKSTLSKVLAGDEAYEITEGDILLDGVSILEEDSTTRSLMGMFLAFQYPVEIPGVNNASFLRSAYNAKQNFLGKDVLDPMEFDELLDEKLNLVGIDASFKERDLNFGFSGGEKKRNEILQLAVLEPKIAVLDETDSGLDVDALKNVSLAVNKLKTAENAFLVITHYQRLLDHIVPDVVHVLVNGKIIQTGGTELAKQLDQEGYEPVIKQ